MFITCASVITGLAVRLCCPGGQPQLVVFARGTDGQVYEGTWSQPGGPWTGWHGIGGNIVGSPAVTAFGQQIQDPDVRLDRLVQRSLQRHHSSLGGGVRDMPGGTVRTGHR